MIVQDAADQLDQPGAQDEDFQNFAEARSLPVPKETKKGGIVLEEGKIKPEGDLEVKVSDNAGETNPGDGDSTEPNPLRTNRFVTPKDFELLKVIGMGAFGKVLQVRHKHTERILAMKVISKRILQQKTGYVENINAERNILTRVRSPFVVTMHCSFQTKEKLFIIMDFLAGGELFLRLGRSGIFLEAQAAFYLAEIILALDHLHTLGILHRDLKPENILLGADGHVCVTDFGLAKDFSDIGGFDDEKNRALTICGTQEYMAPEMLSRQGYGRAADYWSLGCIAYEMLSGLPPFRSKQGGKELFRKIMSEKVKMPVGSTAAACKLLKGLLCRNVVSRLGTTKNTMFEVGGVTALKNMAFFAQLDWKKLELKEVEPPASATVVDDHDLKHFHDEFIGMALPRSVVEMSKEDFLPRRINSDAFRGFSFIQADFDVPERDQGELQAYWDSMEEDGASISDCASSKLGTEDNETPPEPVKKKRPPRKRKKKKRVDTELIAEAPILGENSAIKSMEKLQLKTEAPTCKALQAVEKEPSSIPLPETPTEPLPGMNVPPKQEQEWQSATKTRKKNNRAPPAKSRPQVHSQMQERVPQTRQTAASTNDTQSSGGMLSARPTLRQVKAAHERPAPSSDWRQHTMKSPKSPKTTADWPSLAPAAPSLSRQQGTAAKAVSLQGSWAARTKL